MDELIVSLLKNMYSIVMLKLEKTKTFDQKLSRLNALNQRKFDPWYILTAAVCSGIGKVRYKCLSIALTGADRTPCQNIRFRPRGRRLIFHIIYGNLLNLDATSPKQNVFERWQVMNTDDHQVDVSSGIYVCTIGLLMTLCKTSGLILG
jgi:hypothetical protein